MPALLQPFNATVIARWYRITPSEIVRAKGLRARISANRFAYRLVCDFGAGGQRSGSFPA